MLLQVARWDVEDEPELSEDQRSPRGNFRIRSDSYDIHQFAERQMVRNARS